jgi:hypothetical protein
MSGGPLLPSSVYLSGAAGNLSDATYIPGVNTNTAGAMNGVGVVASLGADAPANLQFNMPESIPTGQLKLRCLAMANASTGNAKITVKDKNVAAGNSLGTSTLITDATAQTITWATADILLETKINLTATPAANDILTVQVTFNTASWTLAATSVWQFSIVWE